MELPKKHKEVPIFTIKKICEHYGLQGLWSKIEKDPLSQPFKSDGCSVWLESWEGCDLYPACFFHDLKYWAGYPGEEVERLIADAELMIDAARRTGSATLAQTMFYGVRIGGTPLFKKSFSWGFGRRCSSVMA
jgi:hypothetical protein